MKTLTLVGAILFLVVAFILFFSAINSKDTVSFSSKTTGAMVLFILSGALYSTNLITKDENQEDS